MPPRISDAERRLISAYIEAANRVDQALRTIGKSPRKALLRAKINPIIQQLQSLTNEYLAKDLPEQFRRGSQEAVKQLKKHSEFKGDIDESFTQAHKNALQQIADDASLSFGRGLQELVKSADRAFSEARKQQIVTEILTSEVTGETANVKKILLDQGVTGIRTANRTLSVDHYTAMLTHTILAEAHNMGAATRYLQNGLGFARRIERADAPDYPCQWLRNKIVWLGEPRFVGPVHPNCFGAIQPYFGDTTEALVSLDDPRIPEKVKTALRRK
ncbi:hypothetical protein Pan258_01920 [Symmachiella dynata]|uniref:hypothetical protein n=1 Tax=Symmachiella dynata TaxID=2527995 RepID=UPI00118B112D|nr:hypothetical protein [Symmachiella dynata]QDT46175.1 hypothetical protein Pan258_01920 [Symmachiella dynata]